LEGEALSDTHMMALVFFRQLAPVLTIKTLGVECSITIGDATLRIWVNQTWTVGQLREIICHRLVFANPQFEILCHNHAQTDNTVLEKVKDFGSLGLVIKFRETVSQLVAFWDISRNLRIGPVSFPLTATFREAAAQLGANRPGHYTFHRSLDDTEHTLDGGMQLCQIAWTTDAIPFHFEARVVAPRPNIIMELVRPVPVIGPPVQNPAVQVPDVVPVAAPIAPVVPAKEVIQVTFILPPEDVQLPLAIPWESTVSQAIQIARLYFENDPLKRYGALTDYEGDFLELKSLVRDLGTSPELWIAEVLTIRNEISQTEARVAFIGNKTVVELAESLDPAGVIVSRHGVAVDPALQLDCEAFQRSLPVQLVSPDLMQDIGVTLLDSTRRA
jgi:hypothetical protein